MAVGLGDDGVPGQIRGQEIGILGQKLREGQDLPSQRLNVGIPWEEFGRVGTPHAGAARLYTDDGNALFDEGRQHGGCVSELAAGAVELARRDPGQAAASLVVQCPGCVAETGQHLYHRGEGVGLEAVAERVHPDQDGSLVPAFRQCGAAAGGTRREPRDLPSPVDPGGPFHQAPQPGGATDDVDEWPDAGEFRDETSPARQPAQGVVVAGSQPSLETFVGDARLVGGHVDSRGAVAGAALAGQAQVEGLGHVP